MRVLVSSEVEHPPGVSPQLIVSGIERVCQGERAVRRSVLHFQLLPFYEISVRREEFHVHDFAQVGEPPLVAPCDVCFIPDGISYEVTGVVDMEVHFFLWQAGSEAFHAGGEGVYGHDFFMGLCYNTHRGTTK